MKNKSQLLWLLIAFLSLPLLSHAQYYHDWAKKLGGNVNTYPKAQTVDNQGNVYITGDNPHFYINKLDSLGNTVWAKTAAYTLQSVYALATDESGNIYIAGRFISTHDFDWSDAGEHLVTVNEQSIFIAKYDSDGNFIWVHHVEGTDIYIYDLKIASNGDIVVIGNFSNTVNIALNGATQEITTHPASGGLNVYDAFVASYDQNGNLLHHINFGEQGNEWLYNIAFTPTGEIIAAGKIVVASDTITLGMDEYMLPMSSINGFFIKINSDWEIANSLIIEGSITTITGLDIDELGNIFVSGWYKNNCDINGSSNTGGELSSSLFNDHDVFVAKYNNAFTLEWGFKVGGMGEHFSGKAVLSENGFWISGSAQGAINSELFFYHTDSTYSFSNVGYNGFSQVFIALLDKQTGIPIERQSYGSNWYTSLTGLDVGANDVLYFSGQFKVEQYFDDGSLPYIINSYSSDGFNFKDNVYVARRTSFCKPIEILAQPETPQSFCQVGFQYEFSATGTGLRYQWYEEDIAMTDFINPLTGWYIVGTHSNFLWYSSPSGGGWGVRNYSLQMANSCGDDFFSDTLVTIILGNPSVLVDQPSHSALVGGTAKLSVQILDDYPNPAYQWYKGQFPLIDGIHFSGVNTDTLTINNIVAADESNYFCIVGSPNCSFDDVATVSTLIYLEVNTTATNDLKNNVFTFDIFPNPTNDFMVLDFHNNKNTFQEIQIIDIFGKNVKRVFLEKNHSQQVTVDVQNIPSGVYFVNVFGEKSLQSQKIIIR